MRDRRQPDQFSAVPRLGGADAPPMGFRALSMVSATTWLIVICAAVFFVDRALPVEWVMVGGPYIARGAPISDVRDLDFDMEGVKPPPNLHIIPVPVVDRRTGMEVGYAMVTRMHWLTRVMHFSTTSGFLGIEYWRFIGFQFLHFDFMHLALNMLGLFIFGPIVEEYLGRKRYVAFYLLAGIFGALMYLTLNLLGNLALMAGVESWLPGLLFHDPKTPLVGASAGVFGVMMAGAFIAPRDIIYYFFLPIRLDLFAYTLTALAAVKVIFGGYNAGGEAGHLGGAIAGFYFIRRPHHLHGFFDILGRVDPTSHHYRKGDGDARRQRRSHEQEVRRVLAKIRHVGIEGLTPEERAVLEEDARRRG